MSQIFDFFVDEQKFTLMRSTLVRHQDSIISKVALNMENNDRMYVVDAFGRVSIFVDVDPSSFKEIVSFMRGYPLNLTFLDSVTKSKLRYDAEYFQIQEIIDQFEQVSEESSETDTEKELFETTSNSESELLDGGSFINEEQQDRITTEKAVENIKNLFSRLREHADSETADTSQMEDLINTIQEKLNTSDSTVINAMSTDPIVIDAVKRYQEGLMKDDSDSDIDIDDFELTITDDDKTHTNVNIIDLLSRSKKNSKVRTSYVDLN